MPEIEPVVVTPKAGSLNSTINIAVILSSLVILVNQALLYYGIPGITPELEAAVLVIINAIIFYIRTYRTSTPIKAKAETITAYEYRMNKHA